MFGKPGYFSQLPTLTTQRLVLRRLKMSDARDMFIYSSDPEVARYVQWRAYESVLAVQAFLRYNQHQSRLNQPCAWGMALKEDDRVFGTAGFTWVNDDNRSGEIGYSLARSRWGCGYATEATEAILAYGFDSMRLHRIEAQHDVRNPASGRVMEKCGMRYEGTLRGRLFNKGVYADMKVYAILEDEWHASRKRK